METPDDEPTFLRGLIKSSRQRPVQVPWTDRDGTARHTALTLPEAARLNAIARGLKISPGEVLRQAAHVPVPKPSVKEGREAASAGEKT
jgi:hypothetical protein